MSIGSKKENFSKLCLIGMSGVGKSFWAEKFHAKDYQVVSCDQLICEHILQKIDSNEKIISCLGTWLGFPWQAGFNQREAIYLDLENEYMFDLSSKISELPTLLDSTGSLIYCSSKTLHQVKSNFLVIYLKLSSEQTEKIISSYSSNPRPILWNNHFPKELDTPTALEIKQQLKLLINERETRYQDLADLTILNEELQFCQNAEDLLLLIKKKYGQEYTTSAIHQTD